MQRHHLVVGTGDIGRPRIHEPAPALEEIGAEIGPLHAAHRMRKRGFCDLPRLAGVGAPVAERGAEAMNGRAFGKPCLVQHPGEHRIGERAAAADGGGEHEPAAVVEHPREFQHVQCRPAQRHAVLGACLHPLARDAPDGLSDVDLLPGRPAHLAGASGGEDGKAQRELRRRSRGGGIDRIERRR